MELAGNLNKYKNKIYLLFFKCNWQDGVLVDALNNKKINEAEQAKNSLIKYANEGLQALDSLKTFKGDPSLALVCKKALISYKKIAETIVNKQTDYFLKSENFEKIKKAMELKSEKTKEDIDAYNKAVVEMNKAVNESNQSNTNSTNLRNEIINNWNQTEKEFMDFHMPKHK